MASSLCDLLMVAVTANFGRLLVSMYRKPKIVGQGETTNLSLSIIFGETKGNCQHLVWDTARLRDGIKT